MAYIERAYLTEQFEIRLQDDNIMYPVMKVLDALEIIDTAPSADVAEVKHGEWVKTRYIEVKRCSCCEKPSNISKGIPNYCSNCGAKIDTLDLINRQKAEIERLQKAIQVQEIMLGNQDYAIKEAKAKAVKEFAERLCEDRVSNDPVVIATKCLLKEFTEGKTDNSKGCPQCRYFVGCECFKGSVCDMYEETEGNTDD